MTAELRDSYDTAFYRTVNDLSRSSSQACVPLILELLRPASVVDVGCGQGMWLETFAELGITDFHGVDGAWVADDQLLIPRERFTRHDLTQPLRLGRRFDVAVSLEVGEHLPARAAEGFVRDLVTLAPAVVFSAAVPGQGGIYHVNEQWPWYWKELFARHGYVQLDPFRKAVWRDPNVAVFYQQNLFLYVDPAEHRRLVEQIGVPDKLTELTLVRTSILQELTRPGRAARLGARLRRLFSRGGPARP